jgi:uncharacterized membrane protein
MIPDDLDRILASEETLLPSSGFAASVMEQVLETATLPPPLPFPWKRFLLGLAAVSVLAAISGWGIASLPIAETMSTVFGRAFAVLQAPHVSHALGGSVASLLGTLLLVRLTLSFTGARR